MDSDRELHPGAEWAHVSFSSRALIAPDGEVLATIDGMLTIGETR